MGDRAASAYSGLGYLAGWHAVLPPVDMASHGPFLLLAEMKAKGS